MADRTCSVEDCGPTKVITRGLCPKHYLRWRTHGTTELAPKPPLSTGGPCSVDGCEKAVTARGLCPMHWYRLRTHGSTANPRKAKPLHCKFDGCPYPANVQGASLGWCKRHYEQVTRKKRPAAPLPAITNTPPRSCAELDCNRKHAARGLCSYHYARRRETLQAGCTVDDCGRPQRAKGLCGNHTLHLRRGGVTPTFTCKGCSRTLPGRRNTLYCGECRPSPHEYAKERKRRLAENNLGMTDRDWELSKEYQAVLLLDPCAYCGGATTAIDHVIPVSRGGSSLWENLAPACKSCNSSKRTKDLLRFMLDRVAVDV